MQARQIKCPTCQRWTVYSEENPTRPFCSERCQILDLGAWASEKLAIAGEPVKPANEVNENPESDDDESTAPPRHHLN